MPGFNILFGSIVFLINFIKFNASGPNWSIINFFLPLIGQEKIILDKVQASVNGTLEVTEKIDNSLIGGFIIRMGDKQFDASVANQFSELKQRLTR